MAGINVALGAGPFFAGVDKDEVVEMLHLAKEYGVTHIDTAQAYGEFKGEAELGKLDIAGQGFTVDTKWPGGILAFFGAKGDSSAGTVEKTAKESVEKLGVKQIDIYYIHAPDAETPIEETLKGVDAAYHAGVFKRFGLSNYVVADIEKIYGICKANNYVLPSVYQGIYAPVSRHPEKRLFPTLRKFNMAFHAYSPLAGGFLTKTREQIESGAGRFNDEPIGLKYKELYVKQSYLEALKRWEEAAKEEGCSRAELAYRWVTYNSPLDKKYGDTIIVGASNPKQLEQTLRGLKNGPLSDKAMKRIDQIWESVKHEAVLSNFEP